jgi:hypothetical protein
VSDLTWATLNRRENYQRFLDFIKANAPPKASSVDITESRFGAVGDGVTLTDQAFADAIDAVAGSEHGIVRVPPAPDAFLTSTPIVLPSNVEVIGRGPASAVRAATTDMDLFHIAANATHCAIRNLGLQGAALSAPAHAGSIASHAGVRVLASASGGTVEVQGVTVPARAAYGLTAFVIIEPGNPDVGVRRARVTGLVGGSVPGAGYGVLTTSDETTVEHCRFTPPAGEGRNAIYLSGTATTGVRGAKVHHNRVRGFTNVPITGHAGGAGLVSAQITANLIEQVAGGDVTFAAIGIYGAHDLVLIHGNTIDLSTATGLVKGIAVASAGDITAYTRGRGASIKHNTILGATAEGIAVLGAPASGAAPDQYPTNATVADNTILGASRGSVGIYSGIRVERANRVTVRDNDIDGAATTLHGVFITNASPLAARTLVSGNSVNDVVGQDVQDDAGSVIGRNSFNGFGQQDSDGYRQVVDGWYQDDVPGTQSAVAMSRSAAAGAAAAFYPVRAGSVTGLVLVSNAARSAGTLTAEVYVAGVATGLTAQLNSTDTTVKATRQNINNDLFSPGQAIDVRLTSAGWGPTTADVRVSVEIAT